MTAPALDALPSLREIIARDRLLARKSLGQHFLCDLTLLRQICSTAGELSGISVIEVGPGPGGLTRALLETDAAQVTVIEKDPRFLPALNEIARADPRVAIVEGDALKINYLEVAPEPRAVVANLPYNIGTELLIAWVRNAADFRSLTLMFQTEVAERICAAPGSKSYGRLSILSQFNCDVKPVLTIPAGAFLPPPKVSSTLVHLTPKRGVDRRLLPALERVTAAAFGQRRKMLRSSLKALGGIHLLNKAELDPTFRAENLSIDDFIRLAGLIDSSA